MKKKETAPAETIRKSIDLPKDVVKTLAHQAVEEGVPLKQHLERLIVAAAKK